jgi:hypothetical protein
MQLKVNISNETFDKLVYLSTVTEKHSDDLISLLIEREFIYERLNQKMKQNKRNLGIGKRKGDA